MPTTKWIIGAISLIGVLAGILIHPPPFLFFSGLYLEAFYSRALFILLLAASLCLYRISRGPTAADRVVAVDILGILVIGFCAILTITTDRSWYIDIGIAWALQSFISSLALAKHLEGRGFEE